MKKAPGNRWNKSRFWGSPTEIPEDPEKGSSGISVVKYQIWGPTTVFPKDPEKPLHVF
jgi:hypothetical protein